MPRPFVLLHSRHNGFISALTPQCHMTKHGNVCLLKRFSLLMKECFLLWPLRPLFTFTLNMSAGLFILFFPSFNLDFSFYLPTIERKKTKHTYLLNMHFVQEEQQPCASLVVRAKGTRFMPNPTRWLES